MEINGLKIIENFITPEEEQQLLEQINQEDWNNSLSRRTQHYGYEYSYSVKNQATKTKDIPKWMNSILKRIEQETNFAFNQVIINEYQPGQGIANHIDSPTLFDEIIVSLSLGSDIVMDFTKDDCKIEKLLKRDSIFILSNDARYGWKHGIAKRKNDNGVKRGIRVSLTFRKMRI